MVLHEGKGRPGKVLNFSLIVLVLLSVAILPLEFLPNFPKFDGVLYTVEAIVIGVFTVEYLLRIYAAPNRLKYIFSFFGIVDLISIMPFYAGLFGTEYVRALRLVRFIKIAEIESSAQNDEEEQMHKGVGLVEGERVEYVVTKSPIVLFLGAIPPVIAIGFGLATLLAFEGDPLSIAVAVVLFLFGLIFVWKMWLDFGYDVIYVTNYRLIFHNQHLLGRSINQVSYPAITNVKPFYPSVFSYLLRYGSLVVDTAAEHPGQIGLHTVRKHEHAAHIIMQKTFEAKQTQTIQARKSEGDGSTGQQQPHP